MTNPRIKDEIKVKVAAPVAPLAPSIGVLVVLVGLVLLVRGASGM